MIKKDEGSAKIHRLQVTHQYKCDLNLFLGLFLYELEQHCKDNGMINKEIYSSRANHRAVDPVIVDVTQTEISMITQTMLVRFNNDATACFDRIMPHILSLCLRSYQMPPEFTALLGDLLWYAKYSIKTANGISKETYSHSDDSLVYGSGQGSTSLATGWEKLSP